MGKEPKKQNGGSLEVGQYLPKPLNIILFLLVILSLGLLWYQKISVIQEFNQLFIELLGAFVVTFLGIFTSMSYTNKQEEYKKHQRSEKVLVGSLKLIGSELGLNVIALKKLISALKDMPKSVGAYYSNHEFIKRIAQAMKSKAFYGAISSGAMDEISEHDKLFNSLQIAYYNMELAINRIDLSQEAFRDVKNKSENQIPPDIVKKTHNIIKKEKAKFERALVYASEAFEEVQGLLLQKGITYTKRAINKKARKIT